MLSIKYDCICDILAYRIGFIQNEITPCCLRLTRNDCAYIVFYVEIKMDARAAGVPIDDFVYYKTRSFVTIQPFQICKPLSEGGSFFKSSSLQPSYDIKSPCNKTRWGSRRDSKSIDTIIVTGNMIKLITFIQWIFRIVKLEHTTGFCPMLHVFGRLAWFLCGIKLISF